MRADGQELPDHFGDATFDLVLCVGSSLHHAEGASGRVAALASMSRLLRRGGHLVLTSRTWDAVVVNRWEIAPHCGDEHHIEIAVAQVHPAGSVLVRSELLSSWPYRYDELEGDLQRVGLRMERSTFDPDAENYTVVAAKV